MLCMQHGTPVKEAVDAQNNQPHIVRFIGASGDISPSHFIAIEQELLLECRSIDSAVFLMMAAHFVLWNIIPRLKMFCIIYKRRC